MSGTGAGKARKGPATAARGRCLCGQVTVEIDVPARWAWHDHCAASRRAHGAACATYVGSWKSRFRITAGADGITGFENAATRTTRHFCARCGTPIFYVRAHSPQMANIPRALFDSGVGREPLYHIAIDETPEWAYAGGPLAPLKGFPGVVWERPRRGKRREGRIV